MMYLYAMIKLESLVEHIGSIRGDGIINIDMENKSDGFFKKWSEHACFYLFFYLAIYLSIYLSMYVCI